MRVCARSESRRLSCDVCPIQAKTTKFRTDVVDSIAESLDGISVRNACQVIVCIRAFDDVCVALHACDQATATTIVSTIAVCAHSTCGIHIAINLQCAIYHAEGNATNLKLSLYQQIIAYAECRKRSLRSQSHKVFYVSAIATALPCRLKECKVCAKILLADDK